MFDLELLSFSSFLLFFFKDFIYVFDRKGERVQAGGTVEREGEAG